jgi:nicotinate-nucleotide pyrophosphorylase (carboxylating)
MTDIHYLLRFIGEDAPFGDITSETLLADRTVDAVIKIKECGMVAGLEEAVSLFRHFGIRVDPGATDGDWKTSGEILLFLKGECKKILLVERTALNIIGRMSGIATLTKKYGDHIKTVNVHCKIAGTRKTAPGLRLLDKKAISIGGGEPHRFSLSDGILIKDNHLALISLENAIGKCRSKFLYRNIEIEVESPDAALRAAQLGADIIMLDNMQPDKIEKALTLLKENELRNNVKIEISGGITEENIQTFAKLDIDSISIGALTHSVRNIDVNLEILGS